jgi:hypothetical protein
MAVLDRYTLADIVEDRKAGLRKLLATLEATSSDSAEAA